MLLFHQPGSSSCLLYLSRQFLSPPSSTPPLLSLALPARLPPHSFTQCIIWRGEAVERLEEWKWFMNGPTYLGAGGGSQWQSGSLIQQPIVPSSLTAGKAPLPPLPLIFYHALLAPHVTVKWLTNCTNTYALQGCICVQGHFLRGTHIHTYSLQLTVYVYLNIHVQAHCYA